MRDSKSNKRIPIEIKAILIIVILLFVGLLTTYILKSYAKFEKKESYNIINAKVGEFYKEFAYTGGAQEYTVPITGYYDIELWGAQGGNSYDAIGRYGDVFGGNGGYTKGTIYLEKDETLYLYIGGQSTASLLGFNGGGNFSNGYPQGGGGGATDIRLTSGTWNESTSLRSRIMVAAGGGGASSASWTVGGAGGGLIGVKSTYENHLLSGYGGTQISGGALATSGPATHTSPAKIGAFGIGGAASDFGSGGGGSGYYGGGGGLHLTPSNSGHGGGGSSYISGYAGVDSVQESGGTAAQPLHTNNTIHYSGKYFINGSMESGVNTGNGKAKIRYVRNAEPLRVNTKLNNVRYIKSCSTVNSTTSWTIWHELQVIKYGVNIAKGKTVTGDKPSYTAPHALYSNITDGDISVATYGHGSTIGDNCIYLDLGKIENVEEIAIWAYYGDVKKTPTSYTLLVSSNNTNWIELHNLSDYVATSQGRRYNAWNIDVVE